jgi:site-specific DNA-adenine methylase
MKPLVKWSGGKTDEIEKIKPHIPQDYVLGLTLTKTLTKKINIRIIYFF